MWATVEALKPGWNSSVTAAPPTTLAPLEHERLQAGLGQEGRGREAVVAAADDDDVGLHATFPRSQSFRISRAAIRPGAPMMPPPGWVAEPHM